MSDVELLFLVLALIYAWECAGWVPLGSEAFRNWFGSRWRHAEPVIRNQKGGFVFAPFLPPLGTLLNCHPWPLGFSPAGILALRPGTRNSTQPAVLRFEEIKKVHVEGKKVIVNNRVFTRAASTTQALQAAEHIRALLKLSPAAREPVLHKLLHERFRIKTIRQRWREFSVRAANLHLLTNVLFVYLFVFAPLMIWRFGLGFTWPSLLAGMYALTFTIAFMFRAVHKHYYPAAKDERFTHLLINMFSPATTIRARDALSRPLLENFHPLAIARVFCTEDQFRRITRAAVLSLRYPAKSTNPAGGDREGGVDRYFKKIEEAAIEDFLKKSGLRIDDLLQPPLPSDETCLAYCPRCLSQFTFAEGECADCGGLKLVPFAPAAKRTQAAVDRRA
jgi:hypothetical protein